MFGTLLAAFILFLIIPLWAGFTIDISDMALHIANYKAFWGTPHPFGEMLKYPQLFYANPLPPLISMPLIITIIIPTLIYFLSKEFIEKEKAIYPPLIWLVLSDSARTFILYGQMHAMVFILLFLIYWVRRNPYSPLLLIPAILGHNGSTYLCIALCGFAFLDYFFRDKDQFFISFLGLKPYKYTFYGVKPHHIIVSALGLISSMKIDKNRNTYCLLLLTLLPSLYFNHRGIIIISAIASIAIVKIMPYDPKVLYYPLCFIVIYSFQLNMESEVYNAQFFYDHKEIIVEAFKINDSYCYYPDCKLNWTSWGCSHGTVWKWNQNQRISVIPCTYEQYLEGVEKVEFDLAEKRIQIRLTK